jgi:8-oxo-dGTP pyrophosphatase MutT (NUDIX family)
MVRPVPSQVIPRPAICRPGEPPPWAHLPESARSDISVARVGAALERLGQSGPVPGDIGSDRVLGPTILINESQAPAVRVVNAGVLALLFDEAGEARLLFTKRATTLRSHRGEISFPGGRLEEGEDATNAALRETYEEIAVNPASVTVMGWIHPVLTMVSGSLIMPIVGRAGSRPPVTASPAEVERVFDVSLRQLADPEIFHEERWGIPGRGIPGSPDNTFAVWFFEVEGEMIWGATARMIHELLSVVLLDPHGGSNAMLSEPRVP